MYYIDFDPVIVLRVADILLFISFSTILFINKKSIMNIFSHACISLLVCMEIRTLASLNVTSLIKGNILLKTKGKPFHGSNLPTFWTCVIDYRF